MVVPTAGWEAIPPLTVEITVVYAIILPALILFVVLAALEVYPTLLTSLADVVAMVASAA